jgi:hypothetical protein
MMDEMVLNAGDCLCPTHASTATGVAINWGHQLGSGAVDRALFTFTEVATGIQTSVEVAPYIHYCFSLEAGLYQVAVRANGLATYRGVVELAAGKVVPLNPTLAPRVDVAPTLQGVLAGLEVPNPNITPRDLDVPANSTIALDSSHPPYKRDWQSVLIKDAEAAKRIIGHPNELWGVNHPRFAAPAPSVDSGPRDLAALAAKEYIYGNSASASQWKQLINEQVFKEGWSFPAFVYGTVTIYAGAVLIIGNRSNFFICQKLRMHVTATLRITGTGPGIVRPLSYESFC